MTEESKGKGTELGKGGARLRCFEPTGSIGVVLNVYVACMLILSGGRVPIALQIFAHLHNSQPVH